MPSEHRSSPQIPEWKLSHAPIPYPEALHVMEQRVEAIRQGTAPELVWLLEHPPLYTLGTSAKAEDILRDDVPTFQTGRGGQVTFHGPGQRVIYVLLDLNRRGRDLRAYINQLEEWLRLVLKELGVCAERRKNRVGLWVTGNSGTDEKIAAIGVRVRHWVTYHGAALNVCPDLSYFEGIIPCGLKDFGITSLHHQNVQASLPDVDHLLARYFTPVFGEDVSTPLL